MLKLDFKNSDKLVKELKDKGIDIFFVGGCVRDYLLGLQPKDIDLIVPHISINDLSDILAKYGSVDLVGKSFGVLKFKPSDGSGMDYDISVPRKERSSGDSHTDFEVDMDTKITLKDDLYRRDFTINAMALSIDGFLIDPFGGKTDLLRNKILKVINNESFTDDPLRMLRLLQFSARFNLFVDKTTLESLKTNVGLIKNITKERISIEFRKGIKTIGSTYTFSVLLATSNMLHTLLGNTDLKARHWFSLKHIWASNMIKTPSLGEYLYSLGIDLNTAEEILDLTREDVYIMKALEEIESEMFRITDFKIAVEKLNKILFKLKPEFIDSIAIDNNLFDLYRIGKLPKSYKELPVNGNDLMELGYNGVEIKNALDTIIQRISKKVLDGNIVFKDLTKSDLIKILKEDK